MLLQNNFFYVYILFFPKCWKPNESNEMKRDVAIARSLYANELEHEHLLVLCNVTHKKKPTSIEYMYIRR